jgi:hypothetical protein
LTLNAVAEEAGVSKGGRLYHFAGKDARLERALPCAGVESCVYPDLNMVDR